MISQTTRIDPTNSQMSRRSCRNGVSSYSLRPSSSQVPPVSWPLLFLLSSSVSPFSFFVFPRRLISSSLPPFSDGNHISLVISKRMECVPVSVSWTWQVWRLGNVKYPSMETSRISTETRISTDKNVADYPPGISLEWCPFFSGNKRQPQRNIVPC